MKRAERHHLKEDELTKLARQAREVVDANKQQATWLISAIVIVGVVALGYFMWREHVSSKADGLLAEASTVQDARVIEPGTTTTQTGGLSFPSEKARAEAAVVKFKAAADAYPSTNSGIYARYQQAATLMSLDRPGDAAAAYQEVVKRAGDDIYGQMGRLGLAEAQARSGQYDQAINGFKELAQRKEGPLPVDGILMHLGQTYVEAGKRADAQQTFNRLVQEYPLSPYSTEARQQLESLKKPA